MAKEEKESKKKRFKEIEDLKQQAGEYLAGWQRAKADYENLRREFIQKQAEYVKFANENLIIELLPILDNFKTAFNNVPEEEKSNPWVTGLSHIKKQLEDLLVAHGVEEIKTVGEEFDPEVHEAVENDFEEDKEEDVILREVKPGYKLNGKVVQCAKVVVCRREEE
jgi:molecular chaperone GrpE